MPSDDITKMLESQDKEVGNARGILARLFRKILADLSVTYYHWDMLMEKYLDNPRNRVPSNTKERSSARGNLNKELRRESMTWKVFDKALRFLGPVRAEFSVKLTWQNKRTSVHSVEVLLGEESDQDEADTPQYDTLVQPTPQETASSINQLAAEIRADHLSTKD
jgi:hypothetical protein